MSTIENRYDFLFLFDCQDGNPNGDPDADNSPRFDPETFQGLVTDVCLKRKIRDYVLAACPDAQEDDFRYGIFVQSGYTLESRQRMPFEKLTGNGQIEAKGKDTKLPDIEKAREWMCRHFFDVRSFGAVMSTTEFNCGQVRGPVQLTFARSIDRVLPIEHTISRQAFTGEKDIKSGTGTLGRKFTIPYGLYLAHGYINPMFAAKTGFSEDDLALLWRALRNLFDLDRSAARGTMSTRGLYIFKHDCKLGNAPSQSLFERIGVEKKPGVEAPRSFADYTVALPEAGSLPAGITFIDGLNEMQSA
jgi:CRISPR-associated protein Csd2